MADIFSLEGEANARSRELAASLVLFWHSGNARPVVIEEKQPIIGGRKCRNCGLQTNTANRSLNRAIQTPSFFPIRHRSNRTSERPLHRVMGQFRLSVD